MMVTINELRQDIAKSITAYEARNQFKSDADIIILNGFMLSGDQQLKEGDSLTLIKRGEIPLKEELESLMVARHTPGVHEKVKKAQVAVAGLGGLGSNIAIALARLGVGYLKLIDFDVVEPSNLNRQQYFIRHIGMKKTEAMEGLISEINPFVSTTTLDQKLDKDNIESLLEDVDIIVEAFDNPSSKALLVNTILNKMEDKIIVAASGMAGYFSNNIIKTMKMHPRFYLIGDGESEAMPGSGLMAPRVAIAAGHQANTVLRIIMGEKEV